MFCRHLWNQLPKPVQKFLQLGCFSQYDWFSMRCCLVGRLPVASPACQIRWVRQVLCHSQMLQRGQPVMVVGAAVVRVSGGLGAGDLHRQGFRPFRPGESAVLVEFEGQGEGLSLPGFCEDRAVIVPGQAGQRCGIDGSRACDNCVTPGQGRRPTDRDRPNPSPPPAAPTAPAPRIARYRRAAATGPARGRWYPGRRRRRGRGR